MENLFKGMTPSREKSNFTFILRHLCDCYYTCIAGLNTQFSKDLSTELRVDIIIFQTCFYKMNSSMISNSCRKKKKKKNQPSNQQTNKQTKPWTFLSLLIPEKTVLTFERKNVLSSYVHWKDDAHQMKHHKRKLLNLLAKH